MSIEQALADMHQLIEEAAELGETSPGAALVPTAGVPATAVKAQMAHVRALAIKKQAALRQAQEQFKARLDSEMQAAWRALAPLEKMVKQLTEGIWTVNLYLGRDEEIVTLADGEPAEASTPIVVRQLVLHMDEECAVAAEDGGIDARSIEEFDEWLLADPAHLDQVLPEARGVVVLTPRRRSRDYNDPWVQERMNKANAHSYWLIRNGQKLYRMDTEFDVGERVVPERDEFTGFFSISRWNSKTDQYEVVSLEPGSREWLKAEEAADARRRHYMRVALILQGLVDRTTVLHPLPAARVSFLEVESYDAGHVRIITDDELALGTGRKPFAEWLGHLCAQLRPGMRILGTFDSTTFHDNRYTSADYRRGHPRLSPEGASYPTTGELYRIEERRANGALVFLYERTDKRWGYEHGDWGRWGDWPYQKRASCEIFVTDDFVLPFDLATVPEMEAYLDARLDRREYLTMIPLLKAAVAAKRAEQAEEEPFRILLAGEIAKANSVPVPDAEEAVADLVDWWKLANRWHRPLIADDSETQAKAIRMIVAEDAARRRAAAGAADPEQEVAARLRSDHPDVMIVGRQRDGRYIALAPQVAGTNVFARQITVSARGKTEVLEWMLPGARWRKWRILWSSPVWESWDHAATLSQHLRGPDIDELVAGFKGEELEGFGPAFAVTYQAANQRFVVWHAGGPVDHTHQEQSQTTNLITKPVASAIDMATTRHTWKRTTGRRIALNSWGNRHAPWGCGRHRDDMPWTQQDAGILLWIDDDEVERITAVHTEVAEVWRRSCDLSETARTVSASIARAWEKEEEQRQYARFLEDYADPDLWEGHRKTLRINFPHHKNGPLHQMVNRLVETGLTPKDVTVAQAAATFAEAFGETLVLPEDVLHLTIGFGVVTDPMLPLPS